MKETKQQWYVSVTEEIYASLERTPINIRLTDSQIADIISRKFGGEKSKHIANIRRSQCNNRNRSHINVPA